MNFRVLTINPGSTSTKISVFEDEKCIFSKNVQHSADELKKYSTISSQLPYRKRVIMDTLTEANIGLSGVDAIVGRGGSFYSTKSGTYEIDDLIVQHARDAVGGIKHPANLGVQLADELCKVYGAKGFTVNPPVVDEYQDLARVTGIKGVYRQSALHALNLKETAIRHANFLGRRYEDCNFIVCHIGGGVSVSAHIKGEMVDGFDIAGGEGPMAPTRCGGVSATALLDYMEEKNVGADTIRDLCMKNGGFVDHFGISDALELTKRANNGDKGAALIWNTMIYQIEKCIGSMAVVMHGKVDGILLGGGMVHSEDLVRQIAKTCSWIAPVSAYPGEFEMEAMAAGAIRVLSGEEKAKKYPGVPVWNGF